MRDLENNWKAEKIPERQYEIAGKELGALRNGKPHVAWENICEAVDENIPGEVLNITDIGCASGYFYEVFQTLLEREISYVGYDYSSAMIKLAEENYPNITFGVADITNLAMDDQSLEIVFSSAVLEHVPKWKEGLLELCRVSGKYLVLSKMPVTDEPFATERKEIYGGVTVPFNKFNREEVVNTVLDQGFKLLHERKVYPKNEVYKIFVFERA